MTKRTLIPIVGLALVAASTPVVAAAASTKTVTYKNIAISPTKVTIKKGDSVRWVWKDGDIRHDVKFAKGGFKKSPLKSSGTYRLTFKKTGTFKYICTVHSGEMKGTVVVR
jgi:plastocyanin